MVFYNRYTHHCESSRCRVVIFLEHPAGNPCVVVLWHYINGDGEVEGVSNNFFTERKTLFVKVIHVFWMINSCIIYLHKSIVSLCNAVESYSSSNWYCVVCRPLYYPCSYAENKRKISSF